MSLRRRNAQALWLLPALGCGGGAPLLHDAHALREGQAQGGLGVSATVTNGSVLRAIDAVGRTDEASSAAGARGAALGGALAPGLAPWVAARVGLGSGNEAGLAYTGRAVRLDARHAWQSGSFALSVGGGASVLLANRDDTANPARWSLAPTSIGGDVPVLIGWRSSAGIVSLYAGPRVGFERIAGRVSIGSADMSPARDVALRHWYGGGLVGLTLGFRHLHGGLELQATYHRVDGSIGALDVGADGLTLSPSVGLTATF